MDMDTNSDTSLFKNVKINPDKTFFFYIKFLPCETNMVHWKINVRHNPFIKYNLLYGITAMQHSVYKTPTFMQWDTL